MDKQTLSNYGWIVICVLVLSVMIAMATPFGNYVKLAVESTTAGLFDTSESALNVVGMSAKGDGSSGSGTQTPTAPTPCSHTNTKTEGAITVSCTTDGHTGKTVCADCGETISNGSTITATGHQNTSIINASSTYTGDTYCNDCNTTIATGETVSSLITFTISGISYQAKDGMTWGEWVESEYNIDKFCRDSSNNIMYSATYPYELNRNSGRMVTTNGTIGVVYYEKIISSCAYIEDDGVAVGETEEEGI